MQAPSDRRGATALEKLGAGSGALCYRAIWNGRLHGLQLAPGVKMLRSQGFFIIAVLSLIHI